jgi:hypothetical protein
MATFVRVVPREFRLLLVCIIGISYNCFMATRAKYTRVRAPEENKEEKPDTDILMRFSPRYGTSLLI